MKNRIVAALLANFLGGIGAHKFYMKNYIMGVVYLIFAMSLIPSVIGFFEGFSLLLQTDYEFNHPNVSLTINEDLLKMLNKLNNHLTFTMILMFISGFFPGLMYWYMKYKLKRHIKYQTNPIKLVRFIFMLNVIIFLMFLFGFFGFMISSSEQYSIIILSGLMFIGVSYILYGIPSLRAYNFIRLYQRILKNHIESDLDLI